MSPPRAVRLGVLICAAVALLAVALVALPASAQNPEVTATPAATGTNPPAKPHNLQASVSHDKVTLTWTASTDPTVTHYAILRRDRASDAIGVFAVIEPNAGPGTSYTDNSVTASGSYVYRVKSVSPTGVSKWSGYRRADTPAAPPPPPEPPPEPPTTTTQPPVPEPPPTATTQPPTIGTGTIERVTLDPPPPPNPDPYSIGDNNQDEGTVRFVPDVVSFQVVTDAETVPLNWTLKPSGLAAGAEFRLLFQTARTGGFPPTSTDIGDYNTYVQGQAGRFDAHAAIRPYASGFRVVGSTAAVAAIDNTSTLWTSTAKGLPIYWLNGSKVADDYEDFYDGTWNDEANPRSRAGIVSHSVNDEVWTGSLSDGMAHSTAFGTSLVEIGRLNGSGGPLNAALAYDPNSLRLQPYYALSEVFTVGAANNSAPVFTDTAPAGRSIAENTGAGVAVGAPVAATDTDTGATLTYSLLGADAGSFTIDSTSGQIRTRSGVSYNFETKAGYSVTVRVTDGTHTTNDTATLAVTITLTDVTEPPGVPGAPRVRTVAGMTDRLNVEWNPPANTGPAITNYALRHRVGDSGTWSSVTNAGTDRTATITGLAAATLRDVQVQVRATSPEGTSAWSPSGQVPADICGRTAQVRAAILAATPAADTCNTISPTDLGAITELNLTNTNLRDLAVGDFTELGGLQILDLSDNLISDLPTGVFDGLTNLIELDLSDTGLLSGLSRDTFADLGNLQILRIANTSFTSGRRTIVGYNPILPDDFFDHLTSLRVLDMRPHSPLLAAPLSLEPLTDLETYNGQTYTQPAAPPRNLNATMSDIDRSWIHRGIRFCKSVRLTWAAPTGVSGITGYKIRRTHYGHPVTLAPNPSGFNGPPTSAVNRGIKSVSPDYGRYGYDIATVGANTTSYVHKPLRPGAAGHKFTYYVAAITNNGDGFPAKVKVKAAVLLKWASPGSATTGPDVLDCPMRW